MNKQIALVTATLSCAVFLAGCSKSTSTATPAEPTTDMMADGSMSDKMKSWAEAVKGGAALKCTFTDAKNTQSTNYEVKGKKMHMVSVSTGEKKTSTEMVNDGEYMYTWEQGKDQGMKIKVPTEAELQEMKEKSGGALKNTPDFTKQEDIEKLQNDGSKIDCTPGVVSDSTFVPPTNVTFQDFSAVMDNALKKAQEGMTDEQKKAVEDAMKKYQK